VKVVIDGVSVLPKQDFPGRLDLVFVLVEFLKHLEMFPLEDQFAFDYVLELFLEEPLVARVVVLFRFGL
jgi:hypothetical protein